MKLTKDEFFSKLANGEIDNFTYNGVRYYSNSSNDFNAKKYEEQLITELRTFLSTMKMNNMFKPVNRNQDKQELFKLFREIDWKNYQAYIDMDTFQYGIEFPMKNDEDGSVHLVLNSDGEMGLLFFAYDGKLNFTDSDLEFKSKKLKFIFPLVVQSMLK